MAKEYVDRQDVLKIIKGTCERCGYLGNTEECACCDYANVIPAIEDMDIADISLAVHGYWDSSGRYVYISGETAVRCSNCGASLTALEYIKYKWNYCPVCGAKMDLEESDGKA